MIARCSDCGRSYLEIDSRRIGERFPRCSACELERIAEAEAERIGSAAQALRALAAIPAHWIGGKR